MIKNLRIIRVLALIVFSISLYVVTVSFYSDPAVLFSSVPPQGRTGATGSYCTGCHQGNVRNASGGSVSISGLPSGSFVAGQKYNFSLTISHGAADRKKWGFSIIAVTNAGVPVGVFSSTNANAKNNGDELSHFNAVATSPNASFTYNNLAWTAPAAPTASEQTVHFYFAGNAADGSFSSSGDFIYSATQQATLASIYSFTGNGFWSNPANWANNSQPPAVVTGTTEVIIHPAEGGECILNIPQSFSAGTKLIIAPGAKFTVQNNLSVQ
jgi:hypothetical protein